MIDRDSVCWCINSCGSARTNIEHKKTRLNLNKFAGNKYMAVKEVFRGGKMKPQKKNNTNHYDFLGAVHAKSYVLHYERT